MEEKIPYFQETSRSQTHLTMGEGQYTLLLPRQRSMASGKGAEKKPSVLWRGPLAPGPTPTLSLHLPPLGEGQGALFHPRPFIGPG